MDDLNSLLNELEGGAAGDAGAAPAAKEEDALGLLLVDLGVGSDAKASRKAKRSSVILSAQAAPSPVVLDAERSNVPSDTVDGEPGSATCASCNLPIYSDVLRALDKDWHIEHFCCVVCSRALHTEPFVPREGRPYCTECFHKMFSAQCAACGEAIESAPVKAMDGSYHRNCFTCCECNLIFADGDGNYTEKDGKAYCDACFVTQFGQACAKCGAPVTGMAIDVGDNVLYHSDCFRCSTCDVAFSQSGAITKYFELDGALYCPTCAPVGNRDVITSTVCAQCGEAITGGEAAVVGDDTYHNACFTCDICHLPLAGREFRLRDTQRICNTCWTE